MVITAHLDGDGGVRPQDRGVVVLVPDIHPETHRGRGLAVDQALPGHHLKIGF